jgi:hypothetical protein
MNKRNVKVKYKKFMLMIAAAMAVVVMGGCCCSPKGYDVVSFKSLLESSGVVYKGEPKNAASVFEAGALALFVGETDEDVEFNKTSKDRDLSDRNSLFLKCRNKDGASEWRLLLTTGSDWRKADGMDKWCLSMASDIKGLLNIRDAKLTTDNRYILMVCDVNIPLYLVACCYDVYNQNFRVFMDGDGLSEQPDGTFLIKNKKTYHFDKNGESLGARWYDVWVTLDGEIIRKGKLKTVDEVVAE